MAIYKEHFIPNLDTNVAKSLFKESVAVIEMAISSYCNKKCVYCPNSIVDRHSNKHYMSDGLFLNIINQLRSIDYSGYICVHRYNEPLANINNALLRLSAIRSFIPNATIKLFTNGDFLTNELLSVLADIGVNEIQATTHASTSEPFADLILKYKKTLERLNLLFESVVNHGSYYNLNTKIKNLNLNYSTYDWIASGISFDRGGCFDYHSSYERVVPCLITFNQLQIEYDGTFVTCCNIHPDLGSHKDAILGKLDSESNIFVEWTNRNYVNWRKKMVVYGKKYGPCAHCTAYLVADTPSNRLDAEHIRSMFEEPA